MKQPQVGKSLDRALSYRMKNAKVLAWHRLAVQDKSLDFLHLIAICLHPLVLLLKIKSTGFRHRVGFINGYCIHVKYANDID